ncbi:WbqC family protein [Lacimicrobium alkaliphilum]|uniref:WbqC-like protein n=1 Tax=Lacimicrobium alkaliphilum TaxID=1526571 RepID=A0A0U3B1X0_9ALTE|nr:WbqC family protein [Lacimicrobium alkaliphilum]ALS99056.1 hypothetical protein AT746_12810 [Lacimicrobium alkaliphilum]
MKVAIMQPYLFPYSGYFKLVKAVDTFVFFDDVAFIKRGFINRNNILVNGQAHRFSLPVEKASQNRNINEHYYLAHQHNFLKTLNHAYKCAPAYTETRAIVENVVNHSDNNVATINRLSVMQTAEYLGVNRSWLNASEFAGTQHLKGQDRIIAICKELDAEIYINPIGGRQLYDEDEFSKNNLKLRFLHSQVRPYPQLADTFIPNLSIIDHLMMQAPKKIESYLDDYQLIRGKEALCL